MYFSCIGKPWMRSSSEWQALSLHHDAVNLFGVEISGEMGEIVHVTFEGKTNTSVHRDAKAIADKLFV